MTYIELIITITFCTIFIEFLLRKWGLNEYYQLYRKEWMPSPCSFCWAWWISFLLTIIIFFSNVFDIPIMLFIFTPMISTGIITLLNR